MSLKTRTAGSPWRGGLAVALAAACLFVWAAPASASSGYFCPATGTTITLGSYSSCTNTTYNALTQVEYYNASAAWWHCASANASSAGTGGNVIASVCGYGDGGLSRVATGVNALGVYGYARGYNDEPASHPYYYGIRYWTP